MDQIILKNVTKRFTTKTLGDIVAVDNFNLNVHEGECFSFLGPSGCGKSTTLRMIAGFEDGLGMVFQSFAVWPHMNVFENVAFPLRIQKLNRTDIEQRVKEAMAHTNLTGLEKAYPSDLSGGQQQRIALARAIVTRPKVMLLDEPLSNLDPKLRESMRFEIKELQRKFNFTIIFVTHDRMMVCDMGKIMQIDTPENLYNRPNSRFVHSFLGESTFLNVIVKDGGVYAEGDLTHPLGIGIPKDADEAMIVATRPNSVELAGADGSGYPTHIEKRIFLTDRTEYLVPVGNQTVKIQTPHRVSFSEGDACSVRFISPMWYPREDDAAEKERQRRLLI